MGRKHQNVVCLVPHNALFRRALQAGPMDVIAAMPWGIKSDTLKTGTGGYLLTFIRNSWVKPSAVHPLIDWRDMPPPYSADGYYPEHLLPGPSNRMRELNHCWFSAAAKPGAKSRGKRVAKSGTRAGFTALPQLISASMSKREKNAHLSCYTI